MSKAYLAAKEKYQAVIDDAGRGDYYCEYITRLMSASVSFPTCSTTV